MSFFERFKSIPHIFMGIPEPGTESVELRVGRHNKNLLQFFYYEAHDSQALSQFYHTYHKDFDEYHTKLNAQHKSEHYHFCRVLIRKFFPLVENEREHGQSLDSLLMLKNLIVREKLMSHEALIYLFHSQLDSFYSEPAPEQIHACLHEIFSDNIFAKPEELKDFIFQQSTNSGSNDLDLEDASLIITSEIMDLQKVYLFKDKLEKSLSIKKAPPGKKKI